MRIATIIARTLMGLLFLFASITFLFKLISPEPSVGKIQVFMEGLVASGYVLPMVKVIELICGLAFVTGRFVALAAVVITPIVVNIVMVHVLLDQKGLPVALFLVVALGMVAYANREAYRPLFKA